MSGMTTIPAPKAPPPTPPLQLLRPDEAARTLAISPRKLWGLAKSGEIPVVRIGRAVRYDVLDLRSWAEEQKCLAAKNGTCTLPSNGVESGYAEAEQPNPKGD